MKLQNYLSIRRILALVSLFFLLLPIGGIYFLRIYESALLRQTESELISQGAFIAALYKNAVLDQLVQQNRSSQNYGYLLGENRFSNDDITPIFPKLDLATDPVMPARPKGLATKNKLDSIALRAGNKISPVLHDAQRITLSGIKILDFQGLVVAGEQEKGLSFSHSEEFKQAKEGKPVSVIRARQRTKKKSVPLGSISRNANVNVYVAIPIVLNNRLVGVAWLNRTPVDLPQALYGKRREIGWTLLFLLVATTFITRLTSLTITRPIRALVQKTRHITQGDPEGLQPLKNPITREVSELSENIASMANTIQQRTDYVKNFTAHISHEFKTPLTAIRGSVELLQDNLDNMPEGTKKRFLNNIADDTKRLDRLVSRLLELTRADLSSAIEHPVALKPLLDELVDRYKQQITIFIHGKPEFALVKVAPESFDAALAHLVENSLQAGASQIDLTILDENQNPVLIFQDNGPGISEANRKEIFTPFFTTKRDQGGTGLGLSIANALLERNKGRIVIEPGESGARFRIDLPPA